MDVFTKQLLGMSEENYKIFSQKLIPDTKYEIMGVRTPKIKAFAKQVFKFNKSKVEEFLSQTHDYHEEWLLHGFLLSFEKDHLVLNERLKFFVPKIDNWAVCDGSVSAIKLLNRHPDKVLYSIKQGLKSKEPYVVRFSIVVLLSYFLDENFSPEIITLPLSVNSNNYYVNMGIAWFYSVALVKRYDYAVKIIENKQLPPFIHNKSIQKAIESFRISNEKKIYLKTLKVKKD